MNLKELIKRISNDEGISDREVDFIEEHLINCPTCGGNLYLYVSPCTSYECCGIPHRVYCSQPCSFEEEDFDLVELIKKYSAKNAQKS